jgi:hypothetical protein
MANPRPQSFDFATFVSKNSVLIQLYRWISHQPAAGACPTRFGMIGKTGATLEKLEEALWFTVMHVRTVRGAHRKLT